MATLMVRGWPDALHKELKRQCLEHDLTLKEILEQAVKMWLKAKAKK